MGDSKEGSGYDPDDMDDLGPPPSCLPGGAPLPGAPGGRGLDLDQAAGKSSNDAGGTHDQDDCNNAPKAGDEVEWDCRFTYTVNWGKNKNGQQTVNEYVLLEELGRGSFGRVLLCERTVGPPPWRRFAMKIMSKPRLRRMCEYVNAPGGGMRKITAEDKMRREIEIMRYLYHRNVVILFEVLEGDTGDTRDPDDEGLVCMIEEYMEGGATMTYDEDSGVFKRKLDGGVGPGLAYSEDEAKPMFRDLCQGLLYLHDQGIIHRDVKPDNLLIFESGTLRICDFGCARRIRITRRDDGHGGEVEDEELLTDSVGTYTFHSPESLSGDGEAYSGRAADAWAAACTLYCWTFGHLPFHDDALEPLFAKIRGEEVQVGRAVSSDLASLLKGMLRKDPSTRLGLRDALQHPWMQGVPEPPPPAGYKPPDTT